ncbi:MAG: MFS transporter [Deltaproteobacteria bacterium]|nr:MFS transporter [Deltaproteobacteria bacterium]
MKSKSASDIFWGWYIVGAAFFVLAINYGSRYCFGVFVKPLATDYGWSRSVISLGASLNMFVYSACAVVIGRMVDRIAPRWIVTGGAVIAAVSFILTAFVREPWQFYLVYGLLLGIGSSGLGVVAINSSVAKWFIRKRGMALGISTMGVSFGTVALTPLAGVIVKDFNWQAGFLVLGIITLVVGVSLSQLFFRKIRPEDHGMLPDGETRPELVVKIDAMQEPIRMRFGDMCGDKRFQVLALSFGLAVMVLMTVFVHQVAFAIDQGIDRVLAASSLAAVGLAGFTGQFFFGWLSDRIRDPKYASFLGMVFMLAGLVVLLQVTSARGLFFYAVIFGFGYGSLAPLMPILLADRFGRHVLGSVYGFVTLFLGIGGSIGPYLAGIMYDRFGAYTYVWQADIVIMIFVSAYILTLKPKESGP